jgi:L-lactate dehydrogenase complex protein LldG
MYEQFKSRATAVGAEVHRCKTIGEAFEFITAFLQKEGAANAPHTTAVWADGPSLRGADKSALCRKNPGLKFDVTRNSAAESHIGICDMDWALADTGSLVADQTEVGTRLASTLPDIHIALVGTTCILPDKTALFTRMSPKAGRYIAFITGPSRTADIERVLTIGVHGPKRLVIVCIDQPESRVQ